jgi:hydrogenase/urease accessory protein HupE
VIPILLLVAASLCAHPNSVSSSLVHVGEHRIELELRCQTRTLLEALPLDTDGDGELGLSELEAGRAALEQTVLEGYRLSVDSAASALAGRLIRTTSLPDRLEGEAYVELDFEFELARAPTSLTIDFALFQKNDPFHRDHAQVIWFGGEPEQRLLWIEDAHWTTSSRTRASARPVLAFIELGIEHILSGWDHIAFLVALVVASRRVLSIATVATAFTLAHSLTLGMSALELVHISGAIVEPIIALSITWVALGNLRARAPRSLIPEAFGFGLIHGLGFAGSIAESLAAEQHRLAALFGFNVGVEIGQLAIVAVLCAAFALARKLEKHARNEAEGLAPRWVRTSASSLVGVLGLYWFVERVIA